MAAPSRPGRIAFGPFEADPGSGELLKHGVRVRISGQPFRILTLLLSQPGELVSHERLKEEIWGDGTFVDFEHGLHAALNKLRRALGDSADEPRYIETVPGRGYRFIGDLERTTPSGALEPELISVIRGPAEKPSPAPVWSRLFWRIAAGALIVLASAFAGRLWFRPPTPPVWKLTQLTPDGVGVSDSPVISKDGKLVVYSAARGGMRDLFLKLVVGGQPVQLTFDGLGNTTPDLSPDGSKIVFRSQRDGGGIYEMPTLGGDSRLLARGGRDPKYSPDGSRVAYWAGEPIVANAVPGNGSLWVVPSTGTEPVRLGWGFTNVRSPIWSWDGRRLLVVGYTSDRLYEQDALDWWLVPVDGGPATRVGMREALLSAGLVAPGSDLPGVLGATALVLPEPRCWLPGGNQVVFSARSGETRNLWQAELPAGGKPKSFERLTTGSADEMGASCASPDQLVFARSDSATSVWALPFDLNHAKPTESPVQIVNEPRATREGISVSGDGLRFAFSSTQASGVFNVWVLDRRMGKEIQLAPARSTQRYPLISPSGDRVAYSNYEGDNRILYLATPGGVPERLCDGCLRPTDWSRDGESLLTFGGSPYHVSLLKVASHQQTILVSHPSHSLLFAHFSPDNHWISFTSRVDPDHSAIMLAPIDGPFPVPERSWIKISDEGPTDASAWSPDGRTVYFTSDRDGHVCMWARRIDPGSHQPIGDAFPVQHFHDRPMSPIRLWSAAGGRIAVTLMETSGNIWLMSRSQTR